MTLWAVILREGSLIVVLIFTASLIVSKGNAISITSSAHKHDMSYVKMELDYFFPWCGNFFNTPLLALQQFRKKESKSVLFPIKSLKIYYYIIYYYNIWNNNYGNTFFMMCEYCIGTDFPVFFQFNTLRCDTATFYCFPDVPTTGLFILH